MIIATNRKRFVEPSNSRTLTLCHKASVLKIFSKKSMMPNNQCFFITQDQIDHQLKHQIFYIRIMLSQKKTYKNAECAHTIIANKSEPKPNKNSNTKSDVAAFNNNISNKINILLKVALTMPFKYTYTQKRPFIELFQQLLATTAPYPKAA